MAIKILSGILVTLDHRDGRVRIDLDDNEVVDGPTGVTAQKTRKIGSGRYDGTPCRMVALREIKIHVTQHRGSHAREDIVENDYLKIDDVAIDERNMEIKWEGTGGSRIEEISYNVLMRR